MQIGELPRWLVGVVRPRIDLRREIVDFDDPVAWQKLVTETFEIEPLIWRSPEQSVEEVEAVDIDVCIHGTAQKELRRAFARRAPDGRSQSGELCILCSELGVEMQLPWRASPCRPWASIALTAPSRTVPTASR